MLKCYYGKLLTAWNSLWKRSHLVEETNLFKVFPLRLRSHHPCFGRLNRTLCIWVGLKAVRRLLGTLNNSAVLLVNELWSGSSLQYHTSHGIYASFPVLVTRGEISTLWPTKWGAGDKCRFMTNIDAFRGVICEGLVCHGTVSSEPAISCRTFALLHIDF